MITFTYHAIVDTDARATCRQLQRLCHDAAVIILAFIIILHYLRHFIDADISLIDAILMPVSAYATSIAYFPSMLIIDAFVLSIRAAPQRA